MVISTLDELPSWASAVLESQRVGHLGVLDGAARPRVLPVTYARHQGAIWTVVDNKPKRADRELARLRWLRQRPHAALTIDHYEETWSALAWVQVIGEIDILDPSRHSDAVAALTSRYSQYEADPPPGPLLRLSPSRAIWWRAADD